MPEMSVIIVNWNGSCFLETCLTSLRQQTFRNFETIVVDNGSEDRSVRYMRDEFPEVNLIELSENRGFAGGNIAGLERASGEIIVLLNNDTEADKHWLEQLHKAALDFPDVGSFACKMLYFNDRQRIENCGFGLTAAGMTVDLGRDVLDGPAWVEPRNVFGACGGAAAYRRSMIENVGFLDPDFFMYYEDVDFGFRGQLQGEKCVLIPSAIVYHRLGATANKYPGHRVFLSQRNIEFVYLKNMPLGLMLRSLPQRFLYELGGAVYFAKTGTGIAFFKAKMEVIRQLPSVLRKRSALQKKKSLSDVTLRSMMRNDWLGTKWKRFWSAWRDSSRAAPDAS
jgi:GT2 family glycosyltransferase